MAGFSDSTLTIKTSSNMLSTCVLSPFRSGGDGVGGWIENLDDPDSYADCSFYTPGRVSQFRQVEG